ncbi:unnamed protein product [Schistosoma margrebowiei]|uniref:cysteine desulfurase n=1 Tax=Schistosoma margrebowiei TaxID=48269 RepID=A0A183LTX2_9TREM|nr:unnamed protein product [Schistosoma margrebowiei]
MFGRLCVFSRLARRRAVYVFREFCAEAEQDGNKSRSCKPIRPLYFDFQASTQLNVANQIGADHKEIIFTSGATESNNLAVKGVAKFYHPKKKHIITTQIVLERSIKPETSLVSVIAVNNEIGVLQPIEEIGRLCRSKGVFFHTDAAQAFGKVPIDVNAMNIDLMSISGHKIYGPQGIGALYVRRRPRVRLEAQQNGGGQERGLRSGTLPTALVVGLGEASRLASEEMKDDYEHVSMLSKRLIDGITSKIQHVTLNGDPIQRYPGCVNFSFACVEGESLLMALKNVALSSGSACTSASLEPSYVLRAIGTEEDLAHSSIRFGIGRFTTEEEVDFTVAELSKHVQRLREMSPLWEMVSEGIDIKSIQWTQH